MFSYLTAGESHGRQLTAIIKKVPSGLHLSADMINTQLTRRQRGYGRGGRMKIEKDQIIITSGVRYGVTLGSPITLHIINHDWENWFDKMSIGLPNEENLSGKIKEILTNPRPGHADLAGAIKYNTRDLRNILERASARETAIRTAVGAVCREFLYQFGVQIWSHVVQIANLRGPDWLMLTGESGIIDLNCAGSVESYFWGVENSPLRCGDNRLEGDMVQIIEGQKLKGDSVGGIFEIIVTGLPVGLGGYVQWDERLDGKLAQALVSIQGMKGLEFGLGFKGSSLPGSQVHDQIYYQKKETGGYFYRSTNRAGGLEGGMTNGEPLIIRVAMKPIPTLMQPLHTIDVLSKEETLASEERADICAVPAASIVGEAVVATVLAQAFANKFGGDSMSEIKRNYDNYQEYVRGF